MDIPIRRDRETVDLIASHVWAIVGASTMRNSGAIPIEDDKGYMVSGRRVDRCSVLDEVSIEPRGSYLPNKRKAKSPVPTNESFEVVRIKHNLNRVINRNSTNVHNLHLYLLTEIINYEANVPLLEVE